MKQEEIQAEIDSNGYKTSQQVFKTWELRNTKMYAASLIDAIDDKRAMSPALRELLEACIVLETINPKILSAYLKRSTTTIRAEFLLVLAILREHSKSSIIQFKSKKIDQNSFYCDDELKPRIE